MPSQSVLHVQAIAYQTSHDFPSQSQHMLEIRAPSLQHVIDWYTQARTFTDAIQCPSQDRTWYIYDRAAFVPETSAWDYEELERFRNLVRFGPGTAQPQHSPNVPVRPPDGFVPKPTILGLTPEVWRCLASHATNLTKRKFVCRVASLFQFFGRVGKRVVQVVGSVTRTYKDLLDGFFD
ncbi:hypothetical protein BDV18DRAFT_162493 [Aspergillus unguis]